MNPRKILVVEDERVVAADIEQSISRLGYTVAGTAASGLEALQQAVNNEPDLVLMDIKLRGTVDGIDAAEQLHESLGIPVVYLTAYADAEILERAKKTAPLGYVLKPFDDRALRSAIEIALHKHQAEKQLVEDEKWLAAAIRSIEEAVIVTRKTGFITLLNLAAEQVTGWNKEEALGKHISDVFTAVDGKTGALLKSPVERVLIDDAGASLAEHTLLVGKDKSRQPVQGRATPLHDDEGNLVGVALVFHKVG